MQERRPSTGARRRDHAEFFPQEWSLAGLGLLLIVFVSLAVRVRSIDGPLRIDEWVSHHLGRFSSNRVISLADYELIARVGAPVFVVVMMLATLIWAVRRRDLDGGLLTVLAPLLSFVLAELVLKPIIARRVDNSGALFAFPSGTVTTVAAGAAAAVALVYRWAGATRALLVAMAVSVAPLSMCVAVVALDWHFATDAIGGLALGGAVVLALAASFGALERRHRRPESASGR